MARERDLLAHLYLHLDDILLRCGKKIGKVQRFDGDLIRSFTLEEMQDFIKTQRINREKLSELRRRRSNYFYFFTEYDEETLFTNSMIIKNIIISCFPQKGVTGLTEVRGQGAYIGRVRGRVYHLSTIKRRPELRSFILVANMTHPRDLLYIKKSAAIVTDEGSILSHAAIVSRELKKPCVIGTKIATKVLKGGDYIEINVQQGIVKKM